MTSAIHKVDSPEELPDRCTVVDCHEPPFAWVRFMKPPERVLYCEFHAMEKSRLESAFEVEEVPPEWL